MKLLFENWRKYLIQEEINVNASKKITQGVLLGLRQFIKKGPGEPLPDRQMAVFSFGGRDYGASDYDREKNPDYSHYSFNKQRLGMSEDLPVTSVRIRLGKSMPDKMGSTQFAVGGSYSPIVGFHYGTSTGEKQFQAPGKNAGELVVQIVYNPELFKTRKDLMQGFNTLLPLIRKTVSHELFHAYQTKKGRMFHKSKEGEYWSEVPLEDMPDVPGQVRYYLADHETEAFVRGFYRQSKITKVKWEDVVNAYLDDIERSLENAGKEYAKELIGLFGTLEEFRKTYREQIMQKWKDYARKELPCATLSNGKFINPNVCTHEKPTLIKATSAAISKKWGGWRGLLAKLKKI